MRSIAEQVRVARPNLDVRVGYLEHGPPHVADIACPGAVVVPLLLASGYHARVDIPAQAPGVVVAAAVGPDAALAGALSERLRAAGYDGRSPVTLAAAGSRDPQARADVYVASGQLAEVLGVSVSVAFVSTGEPRLADVRPVVVASYLLSPGVFADAVAGCGAAVVSPPLGDHPAVASTILARYGNVTSPGR